MPITILEKKILNAQNSAFFYISIEDFVKDFNSLPLGQMSPDFCEKFKEKYKQIIADNSSKSIRCMHLYLFNLKINLDCYIKSESELDLNELEKSLIQVTSPVNGFQDKKAGTYLIPLVLQTLICKVYLTNNALLIDLFTKYFPIPTPQLFVSQGVPVPQIIQDRASKTTTFLKEKNYQPEAIVDSKRIQRWFRNKERRNEELHRIKERDKEYLEEFKITSADLLDDANTPYRPQCNKELSDRIMEAAKHVVAFKTVKHKCSANHFQNILNEGLYGRRTLLEFGIPFSEAALSNSDILNGDGNVICLGPQEIDPLARGEITIEFDLSKLIRNKSPIFFKQFDFEYSQTYDNKVALPSVSLKNKKLNLVYRSACSDPSKSISGPGAGLLLSDGQEEENKAYAIVPKSVLISYNTKEIHQILTLNFFRFLDKAVVFSKDTDMDTGKQFVFHFPNGRRLEQADRAQETIDRIYKEIGSLSDKELVLFLTYLEKSMTTISECNLYGAWQIDFSTVVTIEVTIPNSQGYGVKSELHIPNLIKELSRGNIQALQTANEKIPALFQSYRFLDYLLLFPSSNQCVVDSLRQLRQACQVPEWMQFSQESKKISTTINPSEVPASLFTVSDEPIQHENKKFGPKKSVEVNSETEMIKQKNFC